ncbi:glutamate mutase L [bacterium]|nr:glutamate mutase L [bacterium]
MEKDYSSIERVLATDCGSTTTKAILIEKRDGIYRLIKRGEAPTTVEAPVENVTKGVLNAISELEELTNKVFLRGETIIKDQRDEKTGTDIYISTSSAGGGLQMMVAGVVKGMTAESAERAALGAGAIVMDIIATNDLRPIHEKIERIRNLRPDMILLSGGTDGGTIKHVVELAEIIKAANPKPRLGISYELPVIYAGNIKARDEIKKTLEDITALQITDNIRPSMEMENLMPARLMIQELFLEHVMAHAPGYKHLMNWTDVDIMPTPGAVGLIMQTIAKQRDINIVGVDIGGATTDVFSVFKDIFNRTVSANLGMSYSVSQVFAEAGEDNVMRWLPFEVDTKDVRNRIKNKMIRPTTIPQTIEELVIEQALAREALRLAFIQHKSLAVGLKGVQQQRTISDAFSQKASGKTLINMFQLNMLVGSGGVLSHAPRRNQSALMIIDAFQPLGFTDLTVDSIFMMPQLGVLSQVNEKAATDVFEKDCLIYLGTSICPAGLLKKMNEKSVMEIRIEMPDGKIIEENINYGEIKVYPLGVGEKAKVYVKPLQGFDLGEGKNKKVEKEVHGGVVGIIIDTRGRPLKLGLADDRRVEKLLKWYKAIDMYPDTLYKKIGE